MLNIKEFTYTMKALESDKNVTQALVRMEALMKQNNWDLSNAWLAVAQMLMTCDVWDRGWRTLHNQPVLRGKDDYRYNHDRKPNQALQESILIGDYLAEKLKIPRGDLCCHLGEFIKSRNIQPNNPRAHAFRALVTGILQHFGDPALTFEENVNPSMLFPGHEFQLRYREPRIDLVAYRAGLVVAMGSVRWTYRHDRLFMLEEAMAYLPAARRINPDCRFFGITTEINPARLRKVVSKTAPMQKHAVMERLVHLHKPLATSVIGHNGELNSLMDLEEWVRGSKDWH